MRTGLKLFAVTALSAGGIAWSAPASAAYLVTVIEASGAGPFAAVTASGATLAARPDSSAAAFTYSGALNFSNTSAQNTTASGDLNSAFFTNSALISGYTGTSKTTNPIYGNGGTYGNLAGFLGSSGSAANYLWGSLYSFTSQAGAYGGMMLTITHDDGVSVYANGNLLSSLAGTTAGPTSAVTETVTLPTATTFYTIVYGRENGTPSILTVTTAVPEPASWAMMIGGFGLVGGALRRHRARTFAIA